jgi:hypothetical protein
MSKQSTSPVPAAPQASRRALLTAAPVAAAAVLAGGTVATVAVLGIARAGEVDPIFALISAYDHAANEEMVAYRESNKLEKALPKEQRTWSIHFGGDSERRWPPEGCADAPEWIDAQLAIGEASERISDRMLALLTTAPTTIEGAAVLLERLEDAAFPEERDLDCAESLISTMGNWYDERVEEAAAEVHSTLATALGNIVARGQA